MTQVPTPGNVSLVSETTTEQGIRIMSQVTVYAGDQHFTYLSADDEYTIMTEARNNFDATRVEIHPYQSLSVWPTEAECPVVY